MQRECAGILGVGRGDAAAARALRLSRKAPVSGDAAACGAECVHVGTAQSAAASCLRCYHCCLFASARLLC